MGYILIDLTSTQYSSKSEIEKEMAVIEKLPSSPEVERAMTRLRSYLIGETPPPPVEA